MLYNVAALLFVPTPLLLSYYSGMSLRRFADDQTCIWTVELTEYKFMAGMVFVISASDGACHSYYSYNLWLDHVRGSLLLRLTRKILKNVKLLALYKFISRMSTAAF